MSQSFFLPVSQSVTNFHHYIPFLYYLLLCLLQDAEQQMILTARRSLVAKVARHQPPQIDIFFLNINVRRNCLVEDSLKEVRRFSYGSVPITNVIYSV